MDTELLHELVVKGDHVALLNEMIDNGIVFRADLLSLAIDNGQESVVELLLMGARSSYAVGYIHKREFRSACLLMADRGRSDLVAWFVEEYEILTCSRYKLHCLKMNVLLRAIANCDADLWNVVARQRGFILDGSDARMLATYAAEKGTLWWVCVNTDLCGVSAPALDLPACAQAA